MNKRLIFGLGIAGFLVAAAVAVAQTIPVPTVLTVNNTADLIQIVPRGVPQGGNVYASPGQITNTPQYVKVTPTGAALPITTAPGYANYFGQSQSYLIVVLTTTMPYSYAYAATAPSDGARECVFASGGAITALTFVAASGQTVTGGTNLSVSSNAGACWTYSLSNLTWDRS